MKIRDAHGSLNGNMETTEIKSDCINIIADDGQTLFSIKLDNKKGSITVKSGHHCFHRGQYLTEDFYIEPVAANSIQISKHKGANE